MLNKFRSSLWIFAAIGVVNTANGQCVVGSEAQALVSAVNSISAQASTVNNMISSITGSNDINGALNVQNAAATLQSILSSATASASAFPSPGSSCDSQAVAGALGDATPPIVGVLDALVAKYSTFTTGLVGSVGPGLITQDISGMQALSIVLEAQSYDKFDCSVLPAVVEGFGQIDAAFSAAASKYSVSISSPPSPPPNDGACPTSAGSSTSAEPSSATSSAAGTSVDASSTAGGSASPSYSGASSSGASPSSESTASSNAASTDAASSSVPVSSAPALSTSSPEPSSAPPTSCGAPTGAVASLISAFSALQSDSAVTDNAVESFDKSQGINGALAIQQNEGNIQTDIDNAVTAANQLSNPDSCDLEDILNSANSLTPVVVKLLNDITSKASDLQSVGAGQIVQNDITQLFSSLVKLENAAYGKLDCSAIEAIAPDFQSIEAGFSSAFSAYTASPSATAPTPPTSCSAAASGTPSSGGSPSNATTSAPAESSTVSASETTSSASGASGSTGAESTAASSTNTNGTPTTSTPSSTPASISSSTPSGPVTTDSINDDLAAITQANAKLLAALQGLPNDVSSVQAAFSELDNAVNQFVSDLASLAANSLAKRADSSTEDVVTAAALNAVKAITTAVGYFNDAHDDLVAANLTDATISNIQDLVTVGKQILTQFGVECQDGGLNATITKTNSIWGTSIALFVEASSCAATVTSKGVLYTTVTSQTVLTVPCSTSEGTTYFSTITEEVTKTIPCEKCQHKPSSFTTVATVTTVTVPCGTSEGTTLYSTVTQEITVTIPCPVTTEGPTATPAPEATQPTPAPAPAPQESQPSPEESSTPEAPEQNTSDASRILKISGFFSLMTMGFVVLV